jgi:hypothetical protein
MLIPISMVRANLPPMGILKLGPKPMFRKMSLSKSSWLRVTLPSVTLTGKSEPKRVKNPILPE